MFLNKRKWYFKDSISNLNVYTDSETVQLTPLNVVRLQNSLEKLNMENFKIKQDQNPDLYDVIWFLLLIFNLWTQTDSFFKWMNADFNREAIHLRDKPFQGTRKNLKSMSDRSIINFLKIFSLSGLLLLTVCKVWFRF